MLKKLLLTFLSINILFATVFAPTVKAQTWYSPELGEFIDRVFDEDNPEEIFGERYTYAQVVWIFHSLTTILVPDFILTCMTIDDPEDAGECIADTVSTLLPLVHSPEIQQNPLAGTIDRIITTSPASGIGYLRETAQNLHLIPQVRAQEGGFGYNNLSSIRSLWTAVRNMAYILMIVAFVVMAFMIMFRTKTSPQTVITVQSALPRLIIILLLITFSYAIAGFVIDLAYLLLGLFAILVQEAGGLVGTGGSLELFNALLNSHPIFVMFIIPIIFVIAAFVLGFFTGFSGIGLIFAIITGFFALLFIIFFLIIWIKIIWLMIKTLINIILLTVAGPIIILMGVFPGSGGFGGWLKNLAANVAVFPTITIMIFISHYLFWAPLPTEGVLGALFAGLEILNVYDITRGSASGQIVLPGLNFLSPSTGMLSFFLSFGILALVPAVGNIIKSAISGRPFPYGTAIGAPIAAAFGAASYPIREPVGAITEARRRRFVSQVQEEESLVGYLSRQLRRRRT